MIKNLLYSLFLHFILLAAIYVNFNLKNQEEKISEIVVTMNLDIDHNSNSNKPANSSKQEEKEKIKKELKNKAPEIKEKKSAPKKIIKPQKKTSSQNQSIKKESLESNKQEFKTPEKEEEKEKKEKNPEEKLEEKLNKAEEKEEDPEETKEEAKVADKENSANLANTIDNLDLSAREKFNIQIQLRRCYKKAIEETKLSSKTKIIVKASINESGYIDSDIDDTVDMERYNDPSDTSYKIAIDNARRAMELCSPLRNLPLDKYNVWKEVTLQFDDGN